MKTSPAFGRTFKSTFRSAVVALATSALVVTVSPAIAAPTAADPATAGLVCTGSTAMTVRALHPSTFYVDKSKKMDSQWVGYMVVYAGGTTPADAGLLIPAGSRLGLASGQASQTLTMTANAPASPQYYTTYALLSDKGGSGTLSHTVIFKNNLGAQTNCTYTFGRVLDAQDNDSIDVNDIELGNLSLSTSAPIIFAGQDTDVIVTARGTTGLLEQNHLVALSPTPKITWPASMSVSLVKVRWKVGNDSFYRDRLWFTGKANEDNSYVAEYTFRVKAASAATWPVAPMINVHDSIGATHTGDYNLGAAFSVGVLPTTNLVGVQNYAYSNTLTAAGGQPPYTWSLSSGSTLPAGITLSSSGVLSGTPTVLGTFNFTIEVRDSRNGVGTNSVLPLPFSMTVAEAAIVNNDPSIATVGQPYAFGPINAAGLNGSAKWSVAANLPAGLFWDPSTRMVRGIPTAVSDGTIEITAVGSRNGKETTLKRSYTFRVKAAVTPGTTSLSDLPDLQLGDLVGPYLGTRGLGPIDGTQENGDPTLVRQSGSVSFLSRCSELPEASPRPATWTEGNYAAGSGMPLLKKGINFEQFCLVSDVKVFANAVKDVRLTIEIPSGYKIPHNNVGNDKVVLSAKDVHFGSLDDDSRVEIGNSLYIIPIAKGGYRYANPANAYCKKASGFPRLDCRLGWLDPVNLPAVDGSAGYSMRVAVPIIISTNVPLQRIDMRVELTSPSKERDEIPSDSKDDLRDPDNVAIVSLINVGETSVDLSACVIVDGVCPAQDGNVNLVVPEDTGLRGDTIKVTIHREGKVVRGDTDTGGPVIVRVKKDFEYVSGTDCSVVATGTDTYDVLCTNVLSVRDFFVKTDGTYPTAMLDVRREFQARLLSFPTLVSGNLNDVTKGLFETGVYTGDQAEGGCIDGEICYDFGDAFITIIDAQQRLTAANFSPSRVSPGGTSTLRIWRTHVSGPSTGTVMIRLGDGLRPDWSGTHSTNGANCAFTGQDILCTTVSSAASPAISLTLPIRGDGGSTCSTENLATAYIYRREPAAGQAFTPWPTLPTDPLMMAPAMTACLRTAAGFTPPPPPTPVYQYNPLPKVPTTIDITKIPAVTSDKGITSASLPLLMFIPNLPAGAIVAYAPATVETIKGKIEIFINPDNRSIVVTSVDGWTGKIRVPLWMLTGVKTAPALRASDLSLWSNLETVTTPDAFDATVIYVDITIYPDPSPKGTFTIGAKGTTITFDKSPTKSVRFYTLSVGDKEICRTKDATPTCITKEYFGPKSKIDVKAIGGDDTESTIMNPVYLTSAKPVLVLKVYFDTNKTNLTPRGVKDLNALVTKIKAAGFANIALAGHADKRGTPGANEVLAKKRTATVLGYLKKRLSGVTFNGSAFGERLPFTKGTTDKALAQNRRVEVSVR